MSWSLNPSQIVLADPKSFCVSLKSFSTPHDDLRFHFQRLRVLLLMACHTRDHFGMIRNVINDIIFKWRLRPCFKKNVESARLDGPSLRRRLQNLFQSTLVHLFILSGENITRYAKDISIFMV